MATKKTNSKSANIKKTTNVKKVATPNKKPLSKNKAKDEVEKLVDRLTLFDDTLMAKVFDKNIEATECILSIILNKKIKVITVKGQYNIKSPEIDGHDVTLDIHATDTKGEEIDIEVQGESDGSEIERARFNSSMLDARILKEGQAYKSIKDSYVIFIYKHDKFRLNQPIYHIERTVRESGKEVNDGSHIIYVNGAYKGKDKIGRLIEDFYCKRSVDMHYKELAEGVRYYKETEEGRKVMCKEVRKYGDNRAKEVALNEKVFAVKNLMKNMKITLEKAMDTLNYSGKDREMIAKIILK